jgi:glycosyltransferase involved in cell wall biosynthesis
VRILLYLGWSIDEPGGAEIATQNLAAALSSRGHDIAIVDTLYGQRAASGRTRLFQGPVWSVRIGDLRQERLPLAQFWNIVSRFKPDVLSVQCPSWAQAAPVIGTLALGPHWRLAVALHGTELLEEAESRTSPWLDRLFCAAAAVTTVSESLRQDFAARYPAMAGKIRVIPNGLEPHWFMHPASPQAWADPRYVLYAGRLDPVKGLDILLHAWKRIHTPARQVELWLAGAGAEEERLRALALSLGVADHVRFVGQVTRQELPALFSSAALVVLPSRYEGLPLVALEAGACGAVCIGTRVGGIPEVICDGITGFVVSPESPVALAEALERGLRLTSEVRRRMGTAARLRISRQFTQAQSVAAYERLFGSLLEPVAGR